MKLDITTLLFNFDIREPLNWSKSSLHYLITFILVNLRSLNSKFYKLHLFSALTKYLL